MRIILFKKLILGLIHSIINLFGKQHNLFFEYDCIFDCMDSSNPCHRRGKQLITHHWRPSLEFLSQTRNSYSKLTDAFKPSLSEMKIIKIHQHYVCKSNHTKWEWPQSMGMPWHRKVLVCTLCIYFYSRYGERPFILY